MSLKRSFFLTLLLPASAFCLQEEPWLTEIWEMQFTPLFNYSRFRHVSHAAEPLKKPFNARLWSGDLGVALSNALDCGIEVEAASTTQTPFSVRSYGAQLRQNFLDDLVCDPLSLTGGFLFREATGRSLKDISSPYHARANFEINLAAGKEWHNQKHWVVRAFAFTGLGIANRGSPWTRLRLSLQGTLDGQHQLNLFALGYVGFGSQKLVHIHHFDGYGKIAHRSIDLGIGYAYAFDIWGKISAEYSHRVFARSYPQGVNSITLRYQLPFSIF
jgi:hypothetical protein